MSDIRKDYVKEFEEKKAWGLHVLVDAKGCNEFVTQKDKIITFTLALCEIIEMKRYGECMVIHFGNDPKVAGFSMVQLIETSLISGHFVNESQDAHIDIFSCKSYDPYAVREYIKMFFKPKQIIMQVINRE